MASVSCTSEDHDTTGETMAVTAEILLARVVVLLVSDELAIMVGESEEKIEDAELESDAINPCEECSNDVRVASMSAAAASIFRPSA